MIAELSCRRTPKTKLCQQRACRCAHLTAQRCREPVADQVGQHVYRESMREHDGLGAAVRGYGEQFERPPAGGGRPAPAVWHRWRNSFRTLLSYSGLID